MYGFRLILKLNIEVQMFHISLLKPYASI